MISFCDIWPITQYKLTLGNVWLHVVLRKGLATLFGGGHDIKSPQWRNVPKDKAMNQAAGATIYTQAQSGPFRIQSFGQGRARKRTNHFVIVRDWQLMIADSHL